MRFIQQHSAGTHWTTNVFTVEVKPYTYLTSWHTVVIHRWLLRTIVEYLNLCVSSVVQILGQQIKRIYPVVSHRPADSTDLAQNPLDTFGVVVLYQTPV